VLEPGRRIPVQAQVWVTEGGEPLALGEALGGDGLDLLAFYPFDWSPT